MGVTPTPVDSAGDTGWAARAACAHPSVDRDAFSSKRDSDIAYAKQICTRFCPVIDECRTWAYTQNEKYGTLGGLSAKERGHVRRRPPAVRVAGPRPTLRVIEGDG